MNRILYFASLLFITFISCKKSVQTPDVNTKKSDMTLAVKHKNFGELTNSSKEMISDWEEYETLHELITSYQNISPEEALGNASDLHVYVDRMKDSLTIKSLKTPAFKSRMNVLENEVLRLLDMNEIPAITAKEVNAQIDKMFLIFGSLNDKINTVYDQEKFNEEINLDDFFELERDSIAKLNKNKKVEKPKRKPRNID